MLLNPIVLADIQPFIDALSDMVLVYAMEPKDLVRLVAANSAAAKAGVTENHVGLLLREIVEPNRYDWLKSVARHVVQTKEQYRFEREMEGYSGKFVIDIVLTPVVHQGRCTHILLVARDFTERKEHEQALEFMAFHDPLTGVYNRAFFREQLDHAIHQSRRNQTDFTVGMLDGDHFKAVNDSMGHEAGDGLLMQLSHRIKSVIRSNDIFARIGGDEFAFVFDGLAARDCVPIVTRLMQVLSEPWEIHGKTLQFTCSVGIADSSTGDSQAELLRNADRALYQAKFLGRNKFAIYAS